MIPPNQPEDKGVNFVPKKSLTGDSPILDLHNLILQGQENGKFTSNMFLTQRISENPDMPRFINQKTQKQIIDGFSKLIKIANICRLLPHTILFSSPSGQNFLTLVNNSGQVNIKQMRSDLGYRVNESDDNLAYFLLNQYKDHGAILILGAIGEEDVDSLIIEDIVTRQRLIFSRRDMSSGVRIENFQQNERLLETGNESGIGTLYYGNEVEKPLVRFGGREGAYDTLYERNHTDIEDFGNLLEEICKKIPER